MRKSERQIQHFEEILDVIKRCDTLRIGIQDTPYPYIVPVSFGFAVEEGRLVFYFHGAKEGKKHTLLAKNANVCIEADICHSFIKTGRSATCVYESVIGYGTAEIVTGEEAEKGIRLLLIHCGFQDMKYDTKVLDKMYVYKITVENITGKRRKAEE